MGKDAYVQLQRLGFSNEEIEEMNRKFPNTLNLSGQKVQSVFNELINQGFSKENVHDILIHTPSILGKKINTIRSQIGLYRTIFAEKYREILLANPRRLIQGYNKTLNRYEFLKSKGLSPQEMEKDLFLESNQFRKKYKVEI